VVLVGFSAPRICLKRLSCAYVLVVQWAIKTPLVLLIFSLQTASIRWYSQCRFPGYRVCYAGDAERECVELSARPGQDTSRSGVAAREGAVRQTSGVLRLVLCCALVCAVWWDSGCGLLTL
jgi:hypothetical protein